MMSIHDMKYMSTSYDNISLPLFIIDRELRFRSANESYKELIGFNASLEERYFPDVHPRPLSVNFLAALEVCFNDKKACVLEDYCLVLGRWLEYHFSPGHDEVCVLVLDIDDRKKKSLQESHQLSEIKRCLKGAATGIARISLDGRWLGMNRKCREILGAGVEECAPLARISLPRDQVRDNKRFAALLSGRRQEIISERQIYRHDGVLIWVSLKISLVHNEHNNPAYFVATIDNIEKRKEAEESLRFALTAASMGNWDYDAINDTTRRSPQFDQIFGYKESKPVWRYQDFLSHIHPEDLETANRSFNSALASGKNFILECRILVPECGVRWISLRGRVYLDHLGKAVRMAGIVLDVTREKQAEQELQNAKLSAEDAKREKSYFLANMSHEIRTPLGAILGFAEILSEPSLSFEERLKYVDVIVRNVKNLTELVNEILDLSKVEAGHLEIEKTKMSPWELLENIHTLLKVQADAKGLEFNIKSSGPLPAQILADPIRLRQVLLNIIGNAIKFTPQGCVEVTVEITPGSHIEGMLTFTVKDSGIGISEKAAQGLFSPFVQADSSTTRKYGGTGLGLALCRRLARAMGGDVHLHASTPGEGSVFKISVPALKVEHPPMQEANSVVVTEGEMDWSNLAGLKILVADDSSDNQFLIKRMLNKKGVQIELADDGQDAVQKALRQRYDLVLMDMQMPRLDGYEATRELRRCGFSQPIVALTANAMRHDREKCLDAGCSEYLAKPVNPTRLYKMVGDLIRSSH